MIDEAALGAADGAAYTSDLLLSMALWKAVADRHDLLVATWDSGRVGPTELARLSTLVWGRLDATPRPAASSAAAGSTPVPAGALAVSLPEACRLSDALAASLRARLGLDPSEADLQARLRALRASVERVPRPRRPRTRQGPRRGRLGARPARHPRRRRAGQGAARRRRRRPARAAGAGRRPRRARPHRRCLEPPRRRPRRGQGQGAALGAGGARRGAADLAARCVAQVAPAPRLAVPDVSALGPVPTDPVAVDAYLVRLDAVGGR